MKTSLPLDLPHQDIPISGKWVVEEGEPLWEWTYSSGWQKKVKAVDVAAQSTTHSVWEMFLAESVVKLQVIYDQLGLEKPEEECLIRQVETGYLGSWAASLSF